MTEDMEWNDLIPEVNEKGVVMTLAGGQGAGKTGLGYYLLTLAEEREMDAYSYGIPKEKTYLLPDNVERVRCEPQNLPQNAFILVDEAWIDFFAQEHGSSKNREMGKIVSMARQRKQVMIFVSHVLAKLNLNVIREVNTLIFKKPSLLHMKFERKEIQQLSQQAYDVLKGKEDYEKYSYVFSEDYEGLVTNPLPDFWCEELSNAWAGDVDIYEGSKYAELLHDKTYKELLRKIIAYEEANPECREGLAEGEEGLAGWEWSDVRANASRLNKLVRKEILDITYKSNNSTYYIMNEGKKKELKEVLGENDS